MPSAQSFTQSGKGKRKINCENCFLTAELVFATSNNGRQFGAWQMNFCPNCGLICNKGTENDNTKR
jgi:hypothetical protein